jgi:hypothetical protein
MALDPVGLAFLASRPIRGAGVDSRTGILRRAIHRYSRVPERTFQELLRAESKGRFFNLHIRKVFPSHPIRRAGAFGSTNSA